MNKEDKKLNSLEGEGLSVSLYPDEWKDIASLSGNLFSLIKANNYFLDFHELNDEQKSIMIKWGLENNYIKNCKIYKVSFYSGDLDMNVSCNFVNYEEALTEVCNEEDIEILDGYIATDKMIERTLNECEPSICIDLLSTIYVEDVLKIDGVYWEDILDTSILSAPRGVINLSQIKNWDIKKIN
jgi:hypothetical protein